MRTDEYLRLQMACVAMARQSRTLDAQIRWAKLADAASIAANGGFLVVGNRGADREPERPLGTDA
jgi:hypothetical protein